MHGKPPILQVRGQHSRNIEGTPRKHSKRWRGSAMKRRDPRTKLTPRHLRGKRRGEVWRGQGKVWEGAMIWGSEPSQHGGHCTSHVLPGRRSDGTRRWHGKGRHGEGGRGSCDVCVCVNVDHIIIHLLHTLYCIYHKRNDQRDGLRGRSGSFPGGGGIMSSL